MFDSKMLLMLVGVALLVFGIRWWRRRSPGLNPEERGGAGTSSWLRVGLGIFIGAVVLIGVFAIVSGGHARSPIVHSKGSSDLGFVIGIAVVIALVGGIWYFSSRKRSLSGVPGVASPTPEKNFTQDANDLIPNPIGSGFDESLLNRKAVNIAQSKPATIRGKINEFHEWRTEGHFLSPPISVVAFRLDYPRTPRDFGDLMVKINSKYFRDLGIENGQDIQLELSWKKPADGAYITGIRNITSGQNFEPKRVGKHVGVLEHVESAM